MSDREFGPDAFDEQQEQLAEDRTATGGLAATLLAPTAARYVYNNRLLRWQEVATGRMVGEATVINQMRRHVAATFDTLDELTVRLYAGELTVQQWQTAVAAELKDAHVAQAMFARGGKVNMGATEYGRVGGTLADEYGYLSRFADDIAAGRQSLARARARVKQYGRATQQSYWREWALVSPGKVYWRLNPAEHCEDCINLEAANPYTANTLPTYPGAGATACRGNCNCHLERE